MRLPAIHAPSSTSTPIPTSSRAPRRARVVPIAALLAGTLVLAACGGDDDKDQEPPATPAAAASFNVTSELAKSVPADAQAFAEIHLKPEGDQKAAIDELAKLFGAEGSIADELGLNDDDNDISFTEDVEPHIGDRIAGFALIAENAGKTKTSDDGVDGAMVLPVTDQAKLTASVEKSFADDKDTKKIQIAGQDAYRSDDGAILWVGESLAAVGTEKGVTAAIEAQGGETLDKNERFTNTLKQVRGSDPLAIGWADMQNASGLFAALSALDEDSNDALKELQGSTGAASPDLKALQQFADSPVPDVDATVAMAAMLKPGEFRIEFGGVQPKPSEGSLEEFAKAGADAVGALPAGSWLALGGSLAATEQFPGYSLTDQIKQFEEVTGEKLPAALTSSLDKIETFAVGIKGDSLLAIGGAAIVQTADAAASAELLKTIETELAKQPGVTLDKAPINGADDGFALAIPGAPIRVAVGIKAERLVIGLGAESVSNALDGVRPLREDPAYKQAQEALGGDAPTMIVNPAPLGQLLSDLPADMGGDNEVAQISAGIKAVKLMAASSVATGETTSRGAFVLRYDAAALKQAIDGAGGGSGGGTGTATVPAPTVTETQPGR